MLKHPRMSWSRQGQASQLLGGTREFTLSTGCGWEFVCIDTHGKEDVRWPELNKRAWVSLQHIHVCADVLSGAQLLERAVGSGTLWWGYLPVLRLRDDVVVLGGRVVHSSQARPAPCNTKPECQ